MYTFVMNGNDCPCGATSTFCALVWRTNSQDKGHSKLMPWFVKLFVSNSFHCCVFFPMLPPPSISIYIYVTLSLVFVVFQRTSVTWCCCAHANIKISRYLYNNTLIMREVVNSMAEFLNIFMLMGHYFILKIGYFYMCLALSQIPDGVNITGV